MGIRVAYMQDEAEVSALWRSCGLVVSYNDPEMDFQSALRAPGADVLVHEAESGTIDGTVLVGHDGHRGWLYYVATAPGARGQGIGRMMVKAAEQWLRERDVRKVQLLVRESNTEVVGFYEHLGFVSAPRIVMSKWLK